MMATVRTFPGGGVAVVVGGSGGIGSAVLEALRRGGAFDEVTGYNRSSQIAVDVTDERSIERMAQHIAKQSRPLRLVMVATGILHDIGYRPEKALRDLDGTALAHLLAVNTIGPALLMKHLLPLLPRDGKSVFAALSARVGSIGDNQLGGWYGYRASKAALNQMVRTASVELRRTRPQAICVALHPGTVATRLSQPFQKAGLAVQTPEAAAQRLVDVIEGLTAAESGRFLDHRGVPVPW